MVSDLTRDFRVIISLLIFIWIDKHTQAHLEGSIYLLRLLVDLCRRAEHLGRVGTEHECIY